MRPVLYYIILLGASIFILSVGLFNTIELWVHLHVIIICKQFLYKNYNQTIYLMFLNKINVLSLSKMYLQNCQISARIIFIYIIQFYYLFIVKRVPSRKRIMVFFIKLYFHLHNNFYYVIYPHNYSEYFRFKIILQEQYFTVFITIFILR
jgi:hypothetical protein